MIVAHLKIYAEHNWSVTRSSLAWNSGFRTHSTRSLQITMLRLTEARSVHVSDILNDLSDSAVVFGGRGVIFRKTPTRPMNGDYHENTSPAIRWLATMPKCDRRVSTVKAAS